MTVSLAARAPATFEIKSAQLPLVALHLKSADLALLGQEFAARFGDIPDFFDHDPLLLDLSPLAADRATVPDFGELLHLLHAWRLHPVAVRGGSEAQREAARAAGLAFADDATLTRTLPTPSDASAAAEADAGAAPSEPAPAPAPPVIAAAPALVIDRPVRSGQQIYARGRDLVVLAMVNPGAEVIADGHVHVYAPLRGKAIAGARGDASARVLTLSLEPELVSIAGVYRTSEQPWPEALRGRPAQLRLDGGAEGRLVVEALAA
ncbi:septum site-determining protein MinC [Ramlibacter sp.]|uniref:septum site-determining protein MinC n=1 Tax=Ramlibacter sp. TaxID=1917967 RepID=UPI0035B23C63